MNIAAIAAYLISKVQPTAILLMRKQKSLHRADIRADGGINIFFA